MMSTPNVVSTWERLVRLHRISTTQMDANLRSRCGHSLDEYDVLHQVQCHPEPIRMGELAERLLIANSSCHRIVGRLAGAGFVTRFHGENDGRNVLVELTAQGRRLHRRMAAVHTRDIERVVNIQGLPLDLAAFDVALDALLAGVAGETAVGNR